MIRWLPEQLEAQELLVIPELEGNLERPGCLEAHEDEIQPRCRRERLRVQRLLSVWQKDGKPLCWPQNSRSLMINYGRKSVIGYHCNDVWIPWKHMTRAYLANFIVVEVKLLSHRHPVRSQ